MRAETDFFELVYYHNSETPELGLFFQTLLSRMTEGLSLRSAEDIARYTTDLRDNSSRWVVEDIMQALGERMVGFVPNKYPYSEVAKELPPNSNCQHLCLWSRNGPLSQEIISLMIEEQFPGQSALVFVHQPKMRSVPELSHAHVILVW
jgi:hypothetical protein